MTHLPVEEAERRLRNWRAREDGLLCATSVAVGIYSGQTVPPFWEIAAVICMSVAWVVSHAKRVQAEARLEASIGERDRWRKQRWEELHAEELDELRDTISLLRQELAEDSTPHVH